MKKNLKKITTVLFAVVLLVISTITANAAQTQTQTIELETRSALLIDKSGSMEDQAAVDAALGQYDLASFDAVVNFDHRISTEDNFVGGGNSYICEVLDQIADSGFTHIVLVTDGEQWPQDYSSLSVYTDLNLTIHLVEEDEESAEFVNQLKSKLTNSNLQVVKPDGSVEVILDNYRHPVYEIEIPVVEEIEDEGDKTFIENLRDGYFPWWLILLLAAFIAALFDFIHELITRGRGNNARPIPAAAVNRIKKGARVLADFSGSMAEQQSATAKACRKAKKAFQKVLCFGDFVSEYKVSELKKLQASGGTRGWEAVEQAANNGWNKILIVSDLGFNGKTFDKGAFSEKFKRITVVTPTNYDVSTLEYLKEIADEVEVLYL